MAERHRASQHVLSYPPQGEEVIDLSRLITLTPHIFKLGKIFFTDTPEVCVNYKNTRGAHKLCGGEIFEVESPNLIILTFLDSLHLDLQHILQKISFIIIPLRKFKKTQKLRLRRGYFYNLRKWIFEKFSL